MRSIWMVLVLVVFAGAPAQAIIIDLGDGSGNTTTPADDPGWLNVGVTNGASAVYLGNGWVLAATHVGTTQNISIDGTSYARDMATLTILETDPSTDADMHLVKIIGDPGLASLTISTSQLGIDDDLLMIGHGMNRDTALVYYDSGFNEVTPPPPAAYSGYKWGVGRTTRWGTNKVSTLDNLIPGAGAEETWSYGAVFNDTGGATSEGIVANGDSGGAVFSKATGEWELVGLLLARDTFGGQPSSTGIYGNQSYFADLSFYEPQISAIVPEPSTGLLVGLGLALLAKGRRRHS